MPAVHHLANTPILIIVLVGVIVLHVMGKTCCDGYFPIGIFTQIRDDDLITEFGSMANSATHRVVVLSPAVYKQAQFTRPDSFHISYRNFQRFGINRSLRTQEAF